MSLNFAIFVLYQISTAIDDKDFTDALVTLILRPETTSKIEDMMKNPVLDPKEYSFLWNKITKHHFEFSLVRYQ
jgi:hypothetical protein